MLKRSYTPDDYGGGGDGADDSITSSRKQNDSSLHDESNINDFSDIACLSQQAQLKKFNSATISSTHKKHSLSIVPITKHDLKNSSFRGITSSATSYDINFDGALKRRKLFEQDTKCVMFSTDHLNSSSYGTRFDHDDSNTCRLMNSSSQRNYTKDIGSQAHFAKEVISEQVSINQSSGNASQAAVSSFQYQPSFFSTSQEPANLNNYSLQQKPSIRLDFNETPDRLKGKVSFASIIEDDNSKKLKHNNDSGSAGGSQSSPFQRRRFDSTSRAIPQTKHRWIPNYLNASTYSNSNHTNFDRHNQNLQINASIMLNPNNGVASSPGVNGYNEESVKPKNHFIILAYIKKFVKSMILRSSYRDFTLLEPKHFEMIGDEAWVMKSLPKKGFTTASDMKVSNKDHSSHTNQVAQSDQDILSYRRRQLNHEQVTGMEVILVQWALKLKKLFFECKVFSILCQDRVFLPDQLAVIIWDFIILITIMFHLMVLPVKLCFFVESQNDTMIYFIPFAFFTIDMFIGFNTGIFEFGVIVKDRKLISKAYWKNKLLFHIALTFALVLNYKVNSVLIEIGAITIRLNQILERMSKVNQHFQITFKFPKLSELLQLVALVLFIAHLCGCVFHYVGDQSLKYGEMNSWIHQQNLENEGWMLRYTISIYFAIVTMVTIGYGDIIPMNVYERIYVIFMILFSCGIFAYCINAIGNIFLEQNTKHKAFQQKIFDIQEYLQSKSINKEMQTRVFKYLEYLHEQSDEILTKGQMILSECSSDLREEILKEYYGKILARLRILQNNFSSEFISTLSTKMKEKRFGPSEVILQQGTQLKHIYFISNGGIEYFVNNGTNKIPTCTLQVIDFRLFVSEISCPYSVRSLQTTTVAYLSLEEFLMTIKSFPLDYEKYCMIRDQFLLNGRFESQCLSCGQFGHDIVGCPQIHYAVNLPIFTQKIFFSSIQQRAALQNRRLRKKHSTMLMLSDTKYALKYTRWIHAQTKLEVYANIDVTGQASVLETDKMFLRRCPKIKNNFWDDPKIKNNFWDGTKNQNSPLGVYQHLQLGQSESIQELEYSSNSNRSSSSSSSEEDSDNQTEQSETKQSARKNTLTMKQNSEKSTLTYEQIHGISGLLPGQIPEGISSSALVKSRVGVASNIDPVDETQSKAGSTTSIRCKEKNRAPTILVNLQSSLQKIATESDEIIMNTSDSKGFMTTRKNKSKKKSAVYRSSERELGSQVVQQGESIILANLKQIIAYLEDGVYPHANGAGTTLLKSNANSGGAILECTPSQSSIGYGRLDSQSAQQQQSQNIFSGSRRRTHIKFPLRTMKSNKTQHINHQLSSLSQQQQQQQQPNHHHQHQHNNNHHHHPHEQQSHQTPSPMSLHPHVQPSECRSPLEDSSQQQQKNKRDELMHIFGCMKFSFDHMKEFALYFPKSNCSAVLKSYKKTWQQANWLIRNKKNHTSFSIPVLNHRMSTGTQLKDALVGITTVIHKDKNMYTSQTKSPFY